MAYATLAGLPPPLRPGDVDGILPLAGACFLLAYIEGVSTVRTLLMLVGRVSRPHVAFLGRIPGTRRFSDLARHPDNEVVPGIEGIRVFKAAQGIQHYDVNTQATRQEMRASVCGALATHNGK